MKIEDIGKITVRKVLAAICQRRQSDENRRRRFSWLSYNDVRRRVRAAGDQGERTTGGHSNGGGSGGVVSTQGGFHI